MNKTSSNTMTNNKTEKKTSHTSWQTTSPHSQKTWYDTVTTLMHFAFYLVNNTVWGPRAGIVICLFDFCQCVRVISQSNANTNNRTDAYINNTPNTWCSDKHTKKNKTQPYMDQHITRKHAEHHTSMQNLMSWRCSVSLQSHAAEEEEETQRNIN